MGTRQHLRRRRIAGSAPILVRPAADEAAAGEAVAGETAAGEVARGDAAAVERPAGPLVAVASPGARAVDPQPSERARLAGPKP